ncbi:metallophosphoesterase family protein [Kineococcus gypseus]|uniref:metallophosphoesterase family protein n=1 Tax=Kineococcus gypseus TaxID=1637102 RepID=UPI003D7F0AFA
MTSTTRRLLEHLGTRPTGSRSTGGTGGTGGTGRGWRLARRASVVVLSCSAAAAAVVAAGGVRRDVGPVRARLSLALSARGGTRVALPPAGSLRMDTHAGPFALRVGVEEVDLPAARGLLTDAAERGRLAGEVEGDVRAALRALVLRSALVALGAGALTCAAVFRDARAVGGGSAAVLAALAVGGAVTAGTARPQALARPTGTGPLARVPDLVGAVREARAGLDTYGERLVQLTSNATGLWARLRTLTEPAGEGATRLLWVSDVHNNAAVRPLVRSLVEQFDVRAVLDTGDSTDLGTDVENGLLAPLADLPVPYVWVRGNHDSAATQAYLASLPGVTVLDDGAITEVAGLRVAGTGDPRFTPVKRVGAAPERAARELARAGELLARAVRESPEPVDVALVHEPAMARPLHGLVPLVLDGHVHERRHRTVHGTLELTQGSSGGAGLRALDGGEPLPLQLSVLHFDPATRRLVAVDDVTVEGLGSERVTVERRAAPSYAQQDAQEGTQADAQRGAGPG